ncbi:sulfatase [Pseudoalteromonas sp. APC 3355]|uniref:sulfatase family protein n=1 Tax=Pseudoalteromonas sp. APC 3355 TaxID=3035199 RepID=UPI0025B3AAE0|nr:sulfatase [Pseudoalteromonas sp. APC 3355]MDN3476822.1 sulfatase [Pseudoalteromonas sp. APC 3355]
MNCKKLSYRQLFVWVLLFFVSGLHAVEGRTVKNDVSEKPNILWLVLEDMSPIIEPYGDKTIKTPTITQLANEGVTYTNVYSTSGVCAPSRAAIAMGMYPSSFGANNMRTTSNTEETGLPKYEAIPPVNAKMLSQYLREAGYYTTNNLKTDYQFKAPKAAWDESGPYAHWRNRKPGQPFYAVVNFTTTHESGLFEPYGFRKIESRHYFSDDRKKIAKLPQHHAVKSSEAETPVHVAKDIDFPIPPYLPDTPLVRRDFWKMYNNLAETDKQIAAVLQQLKDDGLYDNTIIMFYSDHGGPLPRQKRLVYDSGLKVPFIIRYPNAKNAGEKDDQLVSFVDFAPTLLNLASIDKPTHMQGRNFLGKQQTAKREYIHAAADRFDGFTDVIRAVRNERFKYIRNYRPEQSYYLPVAYREKIPTMQELLRLRDADQLTPAQALWFRDKKDPEELFDLNNDPHELNNIITDPSYKEVVSELSDEMDRWLNEINDDPSLPEAQLIQKLWAGSELQPETAKPQFKFSNGIMHLSSPTPGAVISYQLSNTNTPELWQLYKGPFKLERAKSVKAVAHRIGFSESESAIYDYDPIINSHH